MSHFSVQLGNSVANFELPHVNYVDLRGYHIKGAIYDRCGVNPDDQVIYCQDESYDGVLEDDDLAVDIGLCGALAFTLQFANGILPPITAFPPS